jgi:hypothetical protein
MCFGGQPNIRKPPAPPNKLNSQADALANLQARRQGGLTAADTNVTGGTVSPFGFKPVAGGAGGAKVLGA